MTMEIVVTELRIERGDLSGGKAGDGTENREREKK
jgi:hypothetical protein